MKTDNAMHKMSITAPTAVKEAINMVSSDPSSGIVEIVVELSVIVVLIGASVVVGVIIVVMFSEIVVVVIGVIVVMSSEKRQFIKGY